jgi:hypothetical protein
MKSISILEPDNALSRATARAKARAIAGVTGYPYDGRTDELLKMLRTMRPAGSRTERDFIEQWISPLGVESDGFGNLWKTVGDSPILWSCHTDTVHNREGVQYVRFLDGCAFVNNSNCLGADDTTGAWLMRQMILAQVPGTYVFHRNEEAGGVGSNWVLDNTPERLGGIRFAIAFDRMGYHDVITHQWGNTASPEFAESLASALYPLHYCEADGVFTDTAVYADLIPECSNISVGYHRQHTAEEYQDIDYAMMLLDTLIAADFSPLQAVRDPAARSPSRWSDDALWDRLDWRDDLRCIGPAMTMDDVCRQYPEIVSDYLTSLGINVDDIKQYGGID